MAARNGATTASESGLRTAWWALRLMLGVGAFAAGLDKFFDLLTTWNMYLAPWVGALVPVSETTFFRAIGVFEMVGGLLVLGRWTRVGAYLLGAWLAAIAIQLASSGMFYDLAVRDLEIATGAFALAKLSEWRRARADLEAR